MRVVSLILLLIFLAGNLLSPAAATEIKVFKLQYASPYSIAHTCESLFGKQGTYVAAPQINAIVVNSDDKELLREIEKLVAVLDRKPATLRFTVKSLASSSENTKRLSLHRGSFPGAGNDLTTSTSSSERSITALEFARASFTDDQVRVYSVPAVYGNELAVLTTSRGLKVSGNVAEGARVMVQVWYAEGGGNETESLLTELEVEPGQWAEFGGLNQNEAQRSTSAGVSRHGKFSVKSGTRQTDRSFAIKVDIVR